MIVKVERCWGGGEKLYFRLTMPCGSRESVIGEVWDRKTASEALDIVEKLYGANRRSVRFKHK